MAIDEKDLPENFLIQARETDNRQAFLQGLAQGENHRLISPFGTLDWRELGPLLVFTLAALLFFERIIGLGTATLNWKIAFDVDLLVGLLMLAGIALTALPKWRTPRELLSKYTLTSLVLLGLVALFFLSHIVDFGIFNYTLDKVELSAAVGLVFIALIGGLALRGSKLGVVVLLGFFLWWGFSVKVKGAGATAENFGFTTIIDLFTSEKGGILIGRFVPPKWDYFARVIDPMLLTVQTAVASTVIGAVVALPLSILAAKNTSPHPAIYTVIRFIINTIRAIPSLILALLFIPFVGLGPAAGILGLGVHTISTLTKLFSESFEAVKPQPIEAMSAVGANSLKAFRWGVFPQAFPLVASYSIYTFESNTRDSTVVAFVGGGGIGFLIQQYTNLLDYATVSVMLIVLVLTVAVMDRFSAFVRSRIV